MLTEVEMATGCSVRRLSLRVTRDFASANFLNQFFNYSLGQLIWTKSSAGNLNVKVKGREWDDFFFFSLSGEDV